jgi:pimeloyl-ACP methyl ester carboxylesterase
MEKNAPAAGRRLCAPLVFIPGDFGDGETAWGEVVVRIGRRARTLVVDRPGDEAGVGPGVRYTFAGDAAAVVRAIEGLGGAWVQGATSGLGDAGDAGVAPTAEVAPSTRGRRASPVGATPASPASPKDPVQFAGLVPNSNPETPVHLVGHSYGGLVALQVAVARPDLVRSLHLIEPPLFALVPDDPEAQAMNREARRIQAEHERVGDEGSTEAFFAMIGAARAVERLRGTAEWEQLTRHAGRFARSEPAGDFPVVALDRLPEELPVALYMGGRSHPALRGLVRAIGERLPMATLWELPEANHAVQRAGEPFVARLLALAEAAEASAAGDPGAE